MTDTVEITVLPLTQDSAEYSVPLQIIPAIQLDFGCLEGDNFSQGDKTLLSVSAVDSFDNEVSLDPSEVDVECNYPERMNTLQETLGNRP